MDITHSLLLVVTIVAMIGALLASIIPFIPGPVLLWGIALVYAALTQSVPTAALVVMTLLMAAGATSDYWLPLVGVRTQGLSCLGAVGSILGGTLGTFLIPVPILGTLIGSILGAMLIEFSRIRQWRHALQAGQITIKLYLWSVIVQFAIGLAILLVFAGSVLAVR
ncbi:MAG: DUF456 domain-containing protein [Anaerolineae bacterium]|nr:DUF456 domain-containing protein [Anaerolineae bacterium]